MCIGYSLGHAQTFQMEEKEGDDGCNWMSVDTIAFTGDESCCNCNKETRGNCAWRTVALTAFWHSFWLVNVSPIFFVAIMSWWTLRTKCGANLYFCWKKWKLKCRILQEAFIVLLTCFVHWFRRDVLSHFHVKCCVHVTRKRSF